MKGTQFILLLFCAFILSSCATIFYGRKQAVYFNSEPSGAEVFVGEKNTGKITPCKILVSRNVKPGKNNKRNEQIYTLKKNGYSDHVFKDRRSFNYVTLGNLIFFGTNYANKKAPVLASPTLGFSSFAVDILTGACLNYEKKIDVILTKKEIVREKEIIYIPDTTKKTTEGQKLPKIYAVVIGVSEYNENSLNLEYADDDAQLFYDHLKSINGGSVPENQMTLLLNKNATRANIIKALNNQFKNAFEEDMIMVYIASHGVPSSIGNKLYFLGSDTDKDNLEGTGISQNDVLEAINHCRAQKKIWITDACHSGGIGMSEATMRGDEMSNHNMVNRLLSDISYYNQSLIMLSASSSGETSRENVQWGGGHGVFTYYLVKGLKGEADANKNNVIDIREAYEYVRENVSKDTQNKQYPELKGTYKDHFPISIKADSEK